MLLARRPLLSFSLAEVLLTDVRIYDELGLGLWLASEDGIRGGICSLQRRGIDRGEACIRRSEVRGRSFGLLFANKLDVNDQRASIAHIVNVGCRREKMRLIIVAHDCGRIERLGTAEARAQT